jgi:hypothetical protein
MNKAERDNCSINMNTTRVVVCLETTTPRAPRSLNSASEIYRFKILTGKLLLREAPTREAVLLAQPMFHIRGDALHPGW